MINPLNSYAKGKETKTYFRGLQDGLLYEFIALHPNRTGVIARCLGFSFRMSVPMYNVGAEVWLLEDGTFTDEAPKGYIHV